MEKFDISIDAGKKRSELGLDSADFVICAVGRLSKEKNQEMLIEASKDLVNLIPQVKFLIVGDGPLRQELESRTHQLNMENYFKFLGTREDIPEILKISNCFVNCSDYETFGLAIVEAMAAGIPIVATDAGGVNEIVKDKETGLVISKIDSAALVKAIHRIKSDDYGKRLADKAKSVVAGAYGIDKIIRRYEDVYFNLHNKLNP